MLALLYTSLVLTIPLQQQSPPAPVPRVDTTGRALRFDFPGMRVGVAEYDEGPTGTTVFYFPRRVKAAVDVRGGAPGTLLTDFARLANESRVFHAVAFSGGSSFGLSAATGVANELKAMWAEQGEHDDIANVLGAIIFDLANRRFTRVTPDDQLGRAAVRSAREGWFPLGARGAGRMAMQGGFYVGRPSAETNSTWSHSGQGGAFWQNGATRIAVFTVVNAGGTIVARDGSVPRCHRNADPTPCPSIAVLTSAWIGRMLPQRDKPAPEDVGPDSGPTANTTITLVVTNRTMPFAALQRLAVQVHTSMARAIQPFATQGDGDVLYAVTTNEVNDSALAVGNLGAIASEVAWDAVLSSLPDLPAPPSMTPVPLSPAAQREFEGVFLFPIGDTLAVSADSGHVVARYAGRRRIYFDAGRPYELIPIGHDLFLVTGPARDVIRFDRVSGRIVGITLNPGPWNQSAHRVR